MAVTKLDTKQAKRLTALGFTVKTGTETEARKKLLEYLKENEITGVDTDPLNDLIEMAAVFKESEGDGDQGEVEEVEAEEEAEETEEEAEEEEAEEEEAEEEEAEEEEELAKPAKKVVPPAKKSVAKKVEEEEEEAEEEEEELIEAAAKEVAKQPKKPAVVAKPDPKKKKNPPVVAAEGEKFDARADEAHMAYLAPFQELFPEEGFEITLLKQGFTVRVLGGNAKTTIMNFDELRIVDEKLVGNFYMNRFKSVEDVAEFLPEELQEKNIGMFRGESHPCIRKMHEDEVLSLLKETDFLTETLKRANATDVKLGINRKKLEETLKKAAPVAKKTVPAKKK